MGKKTKWQKIALTCGIFIFFILMVFSGFRLNERWENRVYEFWMQLGPYERFSPDVILVTIDESIDVEGLWPWGKDWYVYFANFLSGLETEGIGFDISLSPEFKLDFLSHPLLKAAQKRTDIFFTVPLELIFNYKGSEEKSNLTYFEIIKDEDKKFRRYSLLTEKEGEPILSLALALYLSYRKEGISEFEKGRFVTIERLKRGIPLSDAGNIFINYKRYFPHSVKVYSYFDVVFSAFLNSRGEKGALIGLDEFKDKIVLVGRYPKIEQALFRIPSLTNPSSLVVQATVLDNLVKTNFIKKLSPLDNLVILVLWTLFSLFIFSHLKMGWRLFTLLMIFILNTGISFALFELEGIWMDTFTPLLGVFLSFVGYSLYCFGIEKELKLRQRRMELAHQLKEEILLKKPGAREEIDLVIKKSHPKEVEGDFYDFIEIEKGRIALVLGRVPGKGLDTVNYMLKAINELRLQSSLHRRPKAVLNAVNNSLFPESSEGMYATSLYLELDFLRGNLIFSNAGALPLIIIRRLTGELEIFEAENPTPLGIAKNVPFSEKVLELDKGDLLILPSQGIVEIKNRKKEEFGLERLKELISQYRSWEPHKLANKIFERLHRFSEGGEITRECTLLMVRLKKELKISPEKIDGKRAQVSQGIK